MREDMDSPPRRTHLVSSNTLLPDLRLPTDIPSVTFVSWFTVIVAQGVSLIMSDRLPLWAAQRFNKGIWRPEFRVWNMWLSAIIVPVGLAIFGVALQYQYHYMVLALGTFLVNISSRLSVPLLINYITECFITRLLKSPSP